VEVDLPHLARLALDMLKSALDGFVNRDPLAARSLIPRDKQVDALNKEINGVLTEYMTKHVDASGLA